MTRSIVIFLLLLFPALSGRAQQRNPAVLSKNQLVTPFSLDELQRRNFLYFWELADTTNWQIPDRYPTLTFSSIAATGFGLTAYLVGVERGWITRQQAAERVLNTLSVLQELPQGPESSGVAGYRGFFYHFLDLKTARRFQTVELSSIDTGLLMAGILSCMTYFDRNDPTEKAIREKADFLYRRVEWDWYLNEEQRMSMGWFPERGFLSADWRGYNEAMVLVLMAMGSPTHPVGPEAWEQWCKPYYWDTYQGQDMVNFGPLFGHQYSHCWVDFRGIKDPYMREKGIDYFENSRRATLANRQYCIENPMGWAGYGPNIWGLTACDGPQDVRKGNAKHDIFKGREVWFDGYSARGAAVDYEGRDDGTIAPTAAGGSVPFAPEFCIPALETMWTEYGAQLLGPYGYKDAFNPSFTFEPGCENGWFDIDYLGIDQGPIVLMIENYRSGFIWDLMKKNPYIVAGLQRAGFTGGWLSDIKTPAVSRLSPKPANPEVPLEPAGFFRREVFMSRSGQKLPYQLLEPASVGRSTVRAKGASTPPRYPLVVFLHGAGENGTDNASQMRNGVYAFCEKENREKRPCYLLVPQCPPGKRWSGATREESSIFNATPTEPAQAVLELIDQTLRDNPDIDPNRVYITGLSMGGSGAIDLMMRRPDLFAAGLPLCGRGDPAHAKKIKNIPIWIWHGGLDETNPVIYSRRMSAALQKAGGKVKYSELSTFNHDIWYVTYYNPAVMEWLFAQRKK